MRNDQKSILAETIFYTDAMACFLRPIFNYDNIGFPSLEEYAKAAENCNVDADIVPVVVSCLVFGLAEIQPYLKRFGGFTRSFSGRVMTVEAKTELADAILIGFAIQAWQYSSQRMASNGTWKSPSQIGRVEAHRSTATLFPSWLVVTHCPRSGSKRLATVIRAKRLLQSSEAATQLRTSMSTAHSFASFAASDGGKEMH